MNALVYSTSDLDTLFRTVWAEARGDGLEGETAVAWAIRNRAERAYAGSLLGQAGAVEHVCKARLQFSCWNSDDPNLPKLLALKPEDAPELFDLCQDVLDGIVEDPTKSADSYYAPRGMPGGLAPYWAASMKFCGQIGTQLFYDSSHGPGESHRTLYLNCAPGDDVIELKRYLVLNRIYAGALDQNFNDQTKISVEEYQGKVKLYVDGVVGPKTAKSLGLY